MVVRTRTCVKFLQVEAETPEVPLAWKREDRGGDLVNAYQYLKGGGREDRAGLFSVVPSARTKGNEHKGEHRKFHSGEISFLRVLSTGPGSLESPQSVLGAFLCNLTYTDLL